ncbi:acyl-CoA thioesterase [Aequoribacter sp.]|jgi:acyl-CoA thioester hydrolase|uniref:acyl-CoA thioesterase n=1 Tax=Aequoribacter sp. TaxID=2847771 RepID=UPI003C5B17F7
MRHQKFQCELHRYPFTTQMSTRYGDCDVMGHINNVAYARLFEESRIRFGLALHETDNLRHFGRRDRLMLVATHIFYLAEMNYPSDVTVGVGVMRIGSSSYTLSCAMFNEQGACVAVNQSTIANGENGKSAPMSEALRQAAAQFLMNLEGVEVQE